MAGEAGRGRRRRNDRWSMGQLPGSLFTRKRNRSSRSNSSSSSESERVEGEGKGDEDEEEEEEQTDTVRLREWRVAPEKSAGAAEADVRRGRVLFFSTSSLKEKNCEKNCTHQNQ